MQKQIGSFLWPGPFPCLAFAALPRCSTRPKEGHVMMGVIVDGGSLCVGGAFSCVFFFCYPSDCCLCFV